MMIKRMILITGAMILMLAGCAMLEKQANDPQSPLSHAVQVIDASAHAVKDAAPAAGPYGWIAGALATVVAGATGAYKVRQKNQTIAKESQIINAQQNEFNLVRDTTKAIVDAIEEVGMVKINDTNETIGSAIKSHVAGQLENKKIATMGKAIISGIKAAKNEDAQKISR
jgi:hypothetical protein